MATKCTSTVYTAKMLCGELNKVLSEKNSLCQQSSNVGFMSAEHYSNRGLVEKTISSGNKTKDKGSTTMATCTVEI